jgi:hypothetical protein
MMREIQIGWSDEPGRWRFYEYVRNEGEGLRKIATYNELALKERRFYNHKFEAVFRLAPALRSFVGGTF